MEPVLLQFSQSKVIVLKLTFWLREKPLGYDLLLRIDAIEALGGAVIRPAQDMELSRRKESCAAISIEEQDFCTVW